jgi:hypothetical protein
MLAAATMFVALLAGWACASAHAQSFGELGKPFFGTGKGAFKEELDDHAFGVDPTTGDFYVGDQPGANEYRIQDFNSSGTTLLGSVSIKFENSESAEGIEGIAVDPVEKRIYMLVLYEREGKEGNSKFVDPELASAGTLLAFSSEPSGGKLVPATGTKTEGKLEGVLVNKTTFNAQSEVVKNSAASALIEPAGIAVDPTNHDVIVLGKEEQCEKKSVECEEHLLAAAQQVTPSGALAKRWVDTGECFEGDEGAASCFKETHKGETKEEEEEEGADQPGFPASLIVTASGRVLADVTTENELWEIPKAFESGKVTADAPKPVSIVSGETPELHNPLQKLLFFPGAPEPVEGGALSYVHETGEGANEGRIYQMAEVEGVAGEHTDPGVLVLKLGESGSVSEVGWTGGQNKVEQEAISGGGCWISGFSQPMVAASEKSTVFVFDPNHFPANAHTLPAPQVETFGPNGSHCPTASASAPSSSLNGTIDGTSANPVPVGQKVTLSSKLAQANALSVSWNFGEGAPQVVSEPQFQTTKVQHAFATAGEKTVTETITTDNLAQPTVTVSSKVIVAVTGGGGTGVEEPSTVTTTSPPSTTTTSGTQPTSTGTGTSPGTSVLGATSSKGNPDATLAGASLSVTPAGTFIAKVSCPAGETTCVGTITLKTLSAVSAGHGKKKAVLTLASGSFTVAGGASKSVALHLSSAARTLLAHSHVLRARATIQAHDSTGATHSGVTTLTLKLVQKKSVHH